MAASICRRRILNYKNNVFQQSFRTGYIVLIPEAPEEAENELTVRPDKVSGLTTLNEEICKQVMIKHCQNYDSGAWDVNEKVEKMLKDDEKIDAIKNIIEPLESQAVPFISSWGLLRTLYYANQQKLPAIEFSPIDARASHIRKEKFNLQPIYKACKKVLDTESDKLNEDEKSVLNKFVVEGTINGLHLDSHKKFQVQHNAYIKDAAIARFKQKLSYAYTTTFNKIADETSARELPIDFLRCTAPTVEEAKIGPWKITQHRFIHNRYLEYCSERANRHIHWLTRRKLCSKFADERLVTNKEVEDIRMCRKTQAELLGYPCYADLSVKTKMAKTVDNVEDTLLTLLEKAKRAQEIEVSQLESYAYERGFEGNIELWDLDYWVRKQRISLYEFDEVALLDYFPLNQVLLGLFALCEQLFEIRIKQRDSVNSWHQDVRFYEVFDEKTGVKMGDFYIDPYARNGKIVDEDNAGILTVLKPGSYVAKTKPSLVMMFNFTPPDQNKPCLLFFREVKNIFSKFGFMLQNILNESKFFETGGVQNTELDAIGICARFLEQWVFERGTLESISGHFKTGEPLPNHLLDNIAQIQKHMAGTFLSIDIYHSCLDIELYRSTDYCMPIVKQLWPNFLLFELNPYDYHPLSFSQIIVGPFCASYYGLVWSKMVAADAFTAFSEIGFENHDQITELGKRFRSTFFALGGSCDTNEIFKRFRGRNPSVHALLDILDLNNPKAKIAPTSFNPAPAITA